jgi:hypothetical protein
MSRPKKAIKPVEKYLSLPSDLAGKVDLKLFSDLEQRVPYGAWSKYVEGLIRDDLSKKVAKQNG